MGTAAARPRTSRRSTATEPEPADSPRVAEGVHAAELEQWRETVVDGAKSALESGAARSSSRGADTKWIKDLERELRRKDRALAETATLLVLQKKSTRFGGDGDDGTGEGNAK